MAPTHEPVRYHVIFTTPYAFDASEKQAWLDCLERLLPRTHQKDRDQAMQRFFKFGFDSTYWIRFVFEAYDDRADAEVCFLTGV